jgi:hypothetical protein
MSDAHGYPNVKARLRLSRRGPSLPPRDSYLDIWLRGTRFRVRDEAGRDYSEIFADVTASRGLGAIPRSLEAMMDIWSQEPDPDAPTPIATELDGDLATDEGWVRRRGQAAWPIRAAKLTPIAEQMLAGALDPRLAPRGVITRLGRPCVEYHGVLEGEEEGRPYASVVTRVVSPPYLVYSHVQDARHASHSYTREIVALEEGVVGDHDLTPA